MFTLRYFSTKSSDWEQGCRSDDPRAVLAAFDEVAGQRTVPAIELLHEEKVLLRLGLTRSQLMKVAVWGSRIRLEKQATKDRFFKIRAGGVKAVKGGRRRFLDALVV